MQGRRLWQTAVALACGVAVASVALARVPLLHEYFEARPEEDLALNATTMDGTMPLAVDTPSGVIPAPPEVRPESDLEPSYGGSSTPDASDASYRIDRDTTRPDAVGYDDPFRPAVVPFKRLYAYDAVDTNLELYVFDRTLEKLTIGGQPRTGDDQFYGDMMVELLDNMPVRIPSVGPAARVLAARVDPAVDFELLRDGAENWFIRASKSGRVRLILQLAIQRSVFGSEFGDVSWRELERWAPTLPPEIRDEAGRVAAAVGINPGLSPARAVAKLVDYFRSFAPSTDLPEAATGAGLYEELSLSKKGVCRHRAYGFVITALHLGIPARMVRNEAHAWVEVFDGLIWHRVDLGGAAGELDFEQDASVPPHQTPDDPYEWPEGSESGSDMAERAMQRPEPGTADPSTTTDTTDPSGAASPGAASSGPSQPEGDTGTETPSENNEEALPSSKLSLRLPGGEVRRGQPLELQGSVSADGNPCPFVRVDVALRSYDGAMTIGALATDSSGEFSGSVTIPLGVELGDYRLVVSTPGAGQCGPSRQ